MRYVSALRSLPARIARAALHESLALYRRMPLRPDTVFYEAFAGSGVLDNPEAIFAGLRSDARFARLRHVWAIADPALLRTLRETYAGDDASVRFVRYRSRAYFRALSTAGFVVNNATFPPEFGKRDGQVYLNTWHGTPMKTMGYHMPNGAYESANVLRNLVSADYLLSQNSFMTERMYRDAYRLDGVYRGTILEEGYPRVDRQFVTSEEAEEIREELRRRGIRVDGRVVLFAPTWKGTSFSKPVDDVAELNRAVTELQQRLGPEFTVLLKTHQSVFRYARAFAGLERMLVPNDIPTNRVLAVTDALVTDFSSIQFDFLASNRPLVYFVPELAEYETVRGVYFQPDEWPAPVTRTVADLADAVRAGRLPDSAWRERFASLDDGGATARVIDAVWGGKPGRAAVLPRDERRSVLLYLGGMRSNGITSSAVNLVNALPSEQFDVTVAFTRSTRRDVTENAARISPTVRQFQRMGGMNAGRLEHLFRRRSEGRSLTAEPAPVEEMWRAEWRRVFGDSRFDVVVDFSGYGPFWARLLLASPPALRLIWLHNDLSRDAERTVDGRAPLRAGLHAVWALYRRFDRLVSVSPKLTEINRAKLGRHADARAFVTVRNPIDADGFRAQAATPLAAAASFAADPERGGAAIARLRAETDAPWFITVGRLSPEKNHERLIDAFALVHADRPEARLLIVGDGPLRHHLEQLARRSGAADAIVFAGAFSSPAPLMAAASCFVLSSDYEGQPMVLLEAASLGMPIVTVRFDSAEDALPGSGMLIVDRSPEALAEGMTAFLDGRVPPARFDAAGYNAAVVEQFAEVTAR